MINSNEQLIKQKYDQKFLIGCCLD